MKPKLKIDVVSDVVCPWCYIGKRRLENAMSDLSEEFDFDVQYLPFELNPEMPAGGGDQKVYLIQKFGGEDRYKELTGHVTTVAEQEGIQFDYESQKVSPNTRKLHAVIQFAGTKGLQKEMVEIFFNAYFSSGIDLSKEENIIKAALEAGLDESEVSAVLRDDNELLKIAAAEQEISRLGITGVPFYIINNRYGISGAQASATFEKAFRDVPQENAMQGESCETDGKNC